MHSVNGLAAFHLDNGSAGYEKMVLCQNICLVI